MLVANVLGDLLHGITDAVTDAIGNQGLYAVFGLMLIDAVLPAASEVVMVVYALMAIPWIVARDLADPATRPA